METLKTPGYYERNALFNELAERGMVREYDYLAFIGLCLRRSTGTLTRSEAESWALNRRPITFIPQYA